MRQPASTTIDEYLAKLPAAQRAVLQKLRKALHAEAPGAVESISYGLPTLKYQGKVLIYFGAATHHCAVYGVPALPAAATKAYDTSGKGTIRFSPDQPLSPALITLIVATRITAIEAKTKRK
ncbi:MAG: DUF1801 domain-containing protein [Gemmatimonadales bacterium]